MFSELFIEIALVMIAAGVLALVAQAFRQPLVIAYMITGIFVGPAVFGLAQSVEVFETLSRVGVAFLLFIVGLNLNWRNIRDVGGVALASGFAQMILTSSAGYGIAYALGFSTWTCIFLGVSFAFSSTIIMVKMLTDKEDIERLYGRIAVGALIVQDLIAMTLLLALSAYAEGGTLSAMVTGSLLKGTLAVVALWLLARFVVPRLFRFAAKNQELLFLVAITWCFAVASALHVLGFGIEIGALMAGVALAGTGFQHEIEAKVRFVRDFFLVIFFIVLGTHLGVGSFTALAIPALFFSAFVLIGNPIIMFVIMRVMGHHPRTGFLAGTTVAQISEFSFILLGGGIAVGLIEADALPLATLVGLCTIAASSYLITYNEWVFERLAKHISWLRTSRPEAVIPEDAMPHIVLLGFDRMGKEILPRIKEVAQRYVIIDFNPTVVSDLQGMGEPVMYGDAGSEDTLKIAKAMHAKMIISTIPDMEVNADVLDYVQAHHIRPLVILTVKHSRDAAVCYARGAHFVIVPSVLGGIHFAQILKKAGLTKRSWSTVAKKFREADV